jgi:hypothetical protein
MRLALALNLLADCNDLTTLAIDLGFASHSHFSASFKRTYGLTPSDFQRSIGDRTNQTRGTGDPAEVEVDIARVFLSRKLIPISVIPAMPRRLESTTPRGSTAQAMLPNGMADIPA